MKKIRFVIPVAAFLFAFAGAWASEALVVNTDAYQRIMANPIECKLVGQCNEPGPVQCTTTLGTPLYKLNLGVCNTILTGEFIE